MCGDALADFVVSTFGPNGQAGLVTNHPISYATLGSIFELDTYVNIPGQDLNGSEPGSSRRLSLGAPSGINATFNFSLSDDRSNLTLTYSLTNVFNQPLLNPQFLVFIDPEVDGDVNFLDEYGIPVGTLGTGALDANPDSWEIDERGAVFGDIGLHLLTGMLDNTNALPISRPDDVSLGLGFQLGQLNPGDTATISLLLSDRGNKVGTFALEHHDLTLPGDVLTVSGQAVVNSIPEPTSLTLFGTGLVAMAGYIWHRRRRYAPWIKSQFSRSRRA